MIFLVSFALANGAGLLVRARIGRTPGFRSPLYPALPLLGVAGCLGLGAFQAAQVPAAALVAAVWLLAGGALYLGYFRRAAVAVAARAEALDADLVRLRGRRPLVLVPLANPERAEALMSFAHALAVPGAGRVLALGIAAHAGEPAGALAAYDRVQAALRRALAASARHGRGFEAVVRLEPDVPAGIAAVVRERHPEVLLLGMSRLEEPAGTALLDQLIEQTAADLAILQAPAGWELDASVRRVLVPVAGQASHDRLRARVVGTLVREGARTVRLLRVLAPGADRTRAEQLMLLEAEDMGLSHAQCTIVEAADAAAAVLEHAAAADLLVLGLGRRRGRRVLIGEFVLQVARHAPCPLLALAGARAGTARARAGRS
ncbi:MAG: hypothetical protein KatS3mg102_1592 [Planctomycetota bacterium]|nr:MAG: hypothetical protein KatS3mg102_1592 [Planctomycetota bacterium]